MLTELVGPGIIRCRGPSRRCRARRRGSSAPPTTAGRSSRAGRQPHAGRSRRASGPWSRRSHPKAPELARSWASALHGRVVAHDASRRAHGRGGEGDEVSASAPTRCSRWRTARSSGARRSARPGEAFGEAVFNTGMAGYQEVLTDPSYAGQIVAMTSPHAGELRRERRGSGVGARPGRGVRRAGGLPAPLELARDGDARRKRSRTRAWSAIEGIDTRRLTLRLRGRGAMRAAVSTVDLDPASLVARVATQPGHGRDADLAANGHARRRPTTRRPGGPARDRSRPAGCFRVAAYDFGMKRNILRLLAATGCEATVFPADTPPATSLAAGSTGVVPVQRSGRPGGDAVRGRRGEELLGKVPVFGICLGHQLLGARARRAHLQAEVRPPRREPAGEGPRPGGVEITSHNHGFAVDPEGWARTTREHGALVVAPDRARGA